MTPLPWSFSKNSSAFVPSPVPDKTISFSEKYEILQGNLEVLLRSELIDLQTAWCCFTYGKILLNSKHETPLPVNELRFFVQKCEE